MKPTQTTSRRDFIKTSAIIGGALAAPAILSSKVSAAENREMLRVGLIGCEGLMTNDK
ncbi:twin-arginine translocation signal domain-containing protein [Pedosphaera parvula]|uniref:Twin-arginine translocation signal domain-containing protein n=1 Tax=Pedosphaera parvula (strain Ellin514) TaxID=320771 RepID=B9XT49_PEDPL|nr:twin-arginine translocation signal domain-containing protein [Pedosphaera parvula]EEF56984.1 hypothetical protein Cflav_PD0011 [Pedosphaera parvula Ellin514]